MRGQASLEYVLIVAFTFAVLIPGIYFLYTYTLSSSSEIGSAQYTKLGQEMLAMAAQTRAQGKGSWLTLEASVPDTVIDINVSASGEELVIRFRTTEGESSVVFFSDVNLSAQNPTTQTVGSVFLLQPHSGRASFRFTAGSSGLVSIQERAIS